MALPYFAFYPFDWLGDIKVQQLTLEETGAYINLLAYMWTHGHDCTLPLDDRMLSRVLHLPMDRWLEMRDVLIDGESAVFTVLEDGTFTNKRIYEEYQKAISKAEQSKEAGKASAESRAKSKKIKGSQRSINKRSTGVEQALNGRSTDVQPLDLDRDLESTKELKDEEEEYAHTREDDSASDSQDAFDILNTDDEEPSALGRMWRECDTIFPLRFNSIQIQRIEAYVTDDGMEPELIVETLRDARLLGKGIDYALGILRNKHAEGIRTLDEYKMSQEIFQAKKAAKTNETRAAPNANRNADALLRSMQKMGVTIPSTGGT